MELEDKGYFTGWKQVGSVYVAQTKERLHYLKRLETLQGTFKNQWEKHILVKMSLLYLRTI